MSWSQLLFASDGSDFAETGLRQAAELAVRLKATLDVVHVVDIRQAYLPMVPMASGGVLGDLQVSSRQLDSLRQTLQEEGQRVVRRGKEILEQVGVEGTVNLLEGIITQTILEKAREYDVLGLGKKGLSHGWSDDDVGTTMERVVRRATRPLFITAGRPRKIEKLLWAYDASPCSKRMIEAIPAFCSALDIPLTILYVAENDSQLEAGRRRLEQPSQASRDLSVSLKLEVVAGYPEEEILHHAAREDYTMIAIGAHGHHRLVELFLGSVARVVLRRSEVPVLLIH